MKFLINKLPQLLNEKECAGKDLAKEVYPVSFYDLQD